MSATGGRTWRAALAVAVGAGLAVAAALIVGEYPFTGPHPYIAAAAVPAVIGFVVLGLCPAWPGRAWAYTGVISAAGLGWALWISTGRGVDPTPVGGWAAIALALAWPLVWAVRCARRRPSRAAPTPTPEPPGTGSPPPPS